MATNINDNSGFIIEDADMSRINVKNGQDHQILEVDGNCKYILESENVPILLLFTSAEQLMRILRSP